jgi:hypothetical protein
MSTNTLGQLFGGKQAIGFHNSLFCMHPPGLDGIKPGTFGGQKERQNAHPFALLLDLLVVLPDPGPHSFAVMPGGIIPDQEPVPLALLLQLGADPFQKLGGDGADRAPIHKAQRHLVANGSDQRTLLPEDSIAGQGLRVRIILLPDLLHQANWFVFALPGRKGGQGKAAPPDFVQKADGPAWLRARPGNQSVACVFFSRYCGSGLVIQCLARFQLFPNLPRARRTLSPETRWGVSPCWKLIWAAKDKVHTLVSRPKSWGLRCRRSRSARSVSSGKVVRSRWGREEPSSRTAKPTALKPWMMLRTVCLWHPYCLAIAGARSPRSDASRTWARRKTKASLERKPAWICLRSVSVKGRMNRGVFMPSIIPHCRLPFVRLH